MNQMFGHWEGGAKMATMNGKPYTGKILSGEDPGLKCEDESRTRQAFTDECDVNKIVARYGSMEAIPPELRDASRGVYADVSAEGDFRSRMDRALAVQKIFDALPEATREDFKHDPARFLAALADPSLAEGLRRAVAGGSGVSRAAGDPQPGGAGTAASGGSPTAEGGSGTPSAGPTKAQEGPKAG